MAAIEELIGMLYDMVNDAWSLPFGQEKCVIDKDKALDLIEEIRDNLPRDLEQAKEIIDRRVEIISQSKNEAETIKLAAEESAKNLVAEDEITMATRKKANEIMATAEKKAREIRRAANEYADDSLRRLEELMAEALNAARVSRQKFKGAISKGTKDKQ